MGIDNNALLVYGWIFSYEDFINRIKLILSEDDYEEFLETKDLDIINKYLDSESKLKFGDASPYYDSESSDRTYYIEVEFENVDELYELIKQDREFGLIHNYQILGLMGITDRAELFALPHIN